MKVTYYLVVATVALIVLLLVIPQLTNVEQDSRESKEIVAIVNGHAIDRDALEKEIATVEPALRDEITDAMALDFIIEKQLLLEAAFEQNIAITQEDIEKLYVAYENPFVFNIDRLNALLESQNLTNDELTERLAEQAVINKLLEIKSSETFTLRYEDVINVYEATYDPATVAFEEVESEIVDFLIQRHKDNVLIGYVNTLKLQADIQVFIPLD